MTWTLRESQLSDVTALLSLWTEAEAEPTHTDNPGNLEALIRHDRAAFVLAEDGQRLVGSVIAGWDGWRGSIYRLVVASTHRRLGLGRALLEAAESRLVAVGAVRFQAVVVDDEALATAFWRATDWEEQSHRLRFVKG